MKEITDEIRKQMDESFCATNQWPITIHLTSGAFNNIRTGLNNPVRHSRKSNTEDTLFGMNIVINESIDEFDLK